jgi:hypothetical protein
MNEIKRMVDKSLQSYEVQPPLTHSYFDNSDVSHDLAQGLHKS